MPRKIKASNIATGAITSTLFADSGVTAGSYGSSTTIPVLTIDAKGRVTVATTASLPANLASETYVNTAVSNLVNAAPSTLDTLNELAAALGNDASFATTVFVPNAVVTVVAKLALGNDASFATTVTTALGTKTTETYVNARMPSGVIVMWSGSIATIPTGWLLCNGTSGTPDLRNRFIVGAGSTYAVAATGGTADAVVVSHNHGGVTGTDGSHNHTFSGDTNGQSTDHTHSMGYYMDDSNGNNGYLGIVDGDNAQSSNYQTGGTSNNHTHGFSGTTSTASTHSHSISSDGVSGTNQNLPPYYALAYIMKA